MFVEQIVAEEWLKIHPRRSAIGQVGIEGNAQTIAEALIRLFADGWRGAMSDPLKNAILNKDAKLTAHILEEQYS